MEHAAQAELADAKERQAQADIAISAAQRLLQEAEQAKQSAQSARSEAETKVRRLPIAATVGSLPTACSLGSSVGAGVTG